MRFAICDDDVRMTSRIEKIVEQCRDMVEIETEVFLSGGEAVSAIQAGEHFQIYLLDVMMPETDGFDVAEIIRSKDENAPILFITSNKEMMPRAFDVRAFHYLLKTDDDSRLEKIIRKAISYVYTRQANFEYHRMSGSCCVANNKIFYFESRKRKMGIVTSDGEDEFYDTMESVLKRLNPVLFARIHKSFIVNLEYVERFEGELLTLENGTKLTVSKKYKEDFNGKYRNFVLSRMVESDT